MIINKDFVLRQIVGEWMVFPVGAKSVDFNGMLKLNNSGVLLWEKLEEGCEVNDLVKLLMDKYNVAKEQAEIDVRAYLSVLQKVGCIETE